MGPLDDEQQGFEHVHAVEQGPVDLAAAYASQAQPSRWERLRSGSMFNFREHYGDTAGKSVYAYFRLESPRQQQAMLLPGSDDGIRIWHNGTLVFSNDVQRGGLPLQDVVFLDLQTGGNDILIRVRNIADEHNLYLHYRSLEGSVKWSLPERLDDAGLAERLNAAAEAADAADTVPPELLNVDWKLVAGDGDAERGRKLFAANGIGCAKCHSASSDEAVQGGPSLAGARKRFTVPYLIESILLPNRQVSPLFKATTIVTADGKVHDGLVLNETGEKLELLSRQAERIEFNKSSIEQRTLQDISPMPAGLVRKPDELRDILAFLRQLD